MEAANSLLMSLILQLPCMQLRALACRVVECAQ